MLVFQEGGTRGTRKIQPTYDTWPKSKPGHNGGRRSLLSLRPTWITSELLCASTKHTEEFTIRRFPRSRIIFTTAAFRNATKHRLLKKWRKTGGKKFLIYLRTHLLNHPNLSLLLLVQPYFHLYGLRCRYNCDVLRITAMINHVFITFSEVQICLHGVYFMLITARPILNLLLTITTLTWKSLQFLSVTTWPLPVQSNVSSIGMESSYVPNRLLHASAPSWSSPSHLKSLR